MTNICFIILIGISLGEFFYICWLKKQLVEWWNNLKEIKDFPERKLFVKGNGILAQITFELNGLLEKNRRQIFELKKAEEMNQQILANLSHDIRTPLASLTGYLEALAKGKEIKSEEYIKIAYRKVWDLKELADVLFEWFRIQAKEQMYQKEWYDMNELTREIIIEFLPFIEKDKISLETEFSEEEWFFKIDRLAYKRMIRNLISNAISHGRCHLIRMEIQKKEENILLSIFDDGEGISADRILLIFERLYRCDMDQSGGGNGLGLAIVKELVIRMNGRIWVESSVGYGTTFYLEFPIGNVRKK